MPNGRLGAKDAGARFWPVCPVSGLVQVRAWHGWCYCGHGWHWVGW